MKETPYYTTEEAAAILGLDPRQVQRLILNGKLPGAFRVGKGSRAPFIIPIPSVKELQTQRNKKRAAQSND